MNTVNISVPDTEKVINYAPNYFRRINLILGRYTKRSVCSCFSVNNTLLLCVGGSMLHRWKQLRAHYKYMSWRVSLNILTPLTGICRTTWCGVLPWIWWWAWAKLTETPGKPYARYAARTCGLRQNQADTSFYNIEILNVAKARQKKKLEREC